MNIKKLNEIFKHIINEDILTYSGLGKHKVILQLPNGETIEEVVNLHVIGKTHGSWDNNIYDLEPHLAYGGYDVIDDIQYDESSVEIEDEEWERLNLPDGTKVLEIISPIEAIDWDLIDSEPEYNDYDD